MPFIIILLIPILFRTKQIQLKIILVIKESIYILYNYLLYHENMWVATFGNLIYYYHLIEQFIIIVLDIRVHCTTHFKI